MGEVCNVVLMNFLYFSPSDQSHVLHPFGPYCLNIQFTIKRTFIRHSKLCKYNSGMTTIALEELQGYECFLVQAQFYHTWLYYSWSRWTAEVSMNSWGLDEQLSSRIRWGSSGLEQKSLQGYRRDGMHLTDEGNDILMESLRVGPSTILSSVVERHAD